MFTEIGIENFKAFGKMQRIPLKPITLLYGPNSSGKSSLLQALLMLKQTLEEARNENIVLMPKGSLVNVGGYEEFINEHKRKKAFSIGLSFDPYHVSGDEQDWNDYALGLYVTPCSIQITFSQSDTKEIIVNKIDCGGNLSAAPLVGYRNILLDNELQRISKKTGEALDYRMKSIMVRDLLNLNDEDYKANWLRWVDDVEDVVDFSKELDALQKQIKSPQTTKIEQEKIEVYFKWLSQLEQVLKNKSFEQFLKLKDFPFERLISLEHCFPKKLMSGQEEIFKKNRDYELMGTLPTLVNSHVAYLLTDYILIIADFLKACLRRTLYIGPLRTPPERTYEFSGSIPSNVGTAGQHMADILIGRPDIVRKVNEWLNIFEVGYEVEVKKKFRDFHMISLIDRKTLSSASIKDVGFGVSQILPIIIQGIITENSVLCIEQPEIHLHPRLQAELGDFFIHVCNAFGEQDKVEGYYYDTKNQLIIETHSEHLILRLLRRIRETTNGELPEGMPPLRPEDVAVIYAQPTEHGTELMELRISEDGDFIDRWPNGFFTERAKELF